MNYFAMHLYSPKSMHKLQEYHSKKLPSSPGHQALNNRSMHVLYKQGRGGRRENKSLYEPCEKLELLGALPNETLIPHRF
jgi:hypothetical protein